MANEQLEQYNDATRTRAGRIVKPTKNSGLYIIDVNIEDSLISWRRM